MDCSRIQHFCLIRANQEENGIPILDEETEVLGTVMERSARMGPLLGTSACPDPSCTLAGWALSALFYMGGTRGVKPSERPEHPAPRVALASDPSPGAPSLLPQTPLARRTTEGREVMPKVLLVTLAQAKRHFPLVRDQALAQTRTKLSH